MSRNLSRYRHTWTEVVPEPRRKEEKERKEEGKEERKEERKASCRVVFFSKIRHRFELSGNFVTGRVIFVDSSNSMTFVAIKYTSATLEGNSSSDYFDR